MATNKNIKINLDYSEFSGGISECQRKMGLLTDEFKLQQSALGNNANEVNKLQISQQVLSQKIGLQIQIVEQASQKFKALNESESANAAQVDKAQSAYMKQITKLNELRSELESVNKKLEENSKAQNSVSESSKNVTQGLGRVVQSVSSAVMGVTAFIETLGQLKDQLVEAAKTSSEWADNIETLSSQMGVLTETLQEFAYASDFVDVSIETLQGSLSRLTQSMAEAQGGTGEAAEAFNKLQVSVTNSDGSLRSLEEVFYDVIDSLGNISNQAERDAISMSLFGRSAQQLNPLIDSGSKALREYAQEANNLGLVLSGEEVNALSQAQDGFDRLDQVMQASDRRLSATLTPAFSALADKIANLNPGLIDMGNAFGKIIQFTTNAASTANQYVQTLVQLQMAKVVTTGVTMTEAGAETTLAGATMAATAAMIPQIALAAALVAALVALASTIKETIDLYKQYKEVVEDAGGEPVGFAEFNFTDNWKEGYYESVNSGSKQYALGGKNVGGRVWVGEQGAELVDLPNGSTVYNHQESRNMTSSNNVFNITIDAKNVNDFNKVVNVFNGLSQSMSRGGRVNG